jgi:Cdc6-like AAA superfamily ATPase
MEQDRFTSLGLLASTVFKPSVPIAEDSLFAGRAAQVARLVDSVNQEGQHAILYGERGVGKTSLANIIGKRWQGTGYIISPRIGCISTDTWHELWRKALQEIGMTSREARAGFRTEEIESTVDAAKNLGEAFGINDVRAVLGAVGRQVVLVLIFDEFDLLHAKTRKGMAETIKQFSDYNVPVTLILVGVADSIGDLLRDHQSVERALVQVQMPRMPDNELREIIEKGLLTLAMTISEEALDRIVLLSRGLPHYTHLLGLHSTRQALERQSLRVEDGDVRGAITVALDNSHQSTVDAYTKATFSPQRNHLYRQVLLACALADTNELGFFTASAVRDPLTTIMGKRYDVPSYARHLNEFCDEKRAHILERTGVQRNYKFRFKNPLMQPHVILQGYKAGMVKGTLPRNGKGRAPVKG